MPRGVPFARYIPHVGQTDLGLCCIIDKSDFSHMRLSKGMQNFPHLVIGTMFTFSRPFTLSSIVVLGYNV